MDIPAGAPAPPTPAERPAHAPLHGRYTSILPVSTTHADSFYRNLGGEENYHRWQYMTVGGLPDLKATEERVRGWTESSDPLMFTVLSGPASDPASEPAGALSYYNIVPDHLRIEIGFIIMSAKLRRTRAATEAFFLVIKHAFDLGYHRVEWKANNLNKPSLAAAERLGFVPEGVFRYVSLHRGLCHFAPSLTFGFQTSYDYQGTCKRHGVV